MSVHQYQVKGPDGREYGPVDLAVLQEWVRQGRVTHDSKVRNLGNGMLLNASNMPELDGFFPALYARQNSAIAAGSIYTGQTPQAPDRWEDYKFVIVMSVVGMALSVILSWFACIFCIIGMIRAWQAAKEQRPMAGVAFAIALFSLLASIAIPFMMTTWLAHIFGFFNAPPPKSTFDR